MSQVALTGPSPAAEVRVREYNSDDLAAVIHLFRSSVREVARRDYSERQVIAWAPDHIDPQNWATYLSAQPTWVAEIDEEIAGFTSLEPDGHIDMLYVHPHHQAKGVARALLGHIESVAIDRGLDRLYTEASITARRAFERKGYRIVNTQIVTVRGETFTNHRMEKRLKAPRSED